MALDTSRHHHAHRCTSTSSLSCSGDKESPSPARLSISRYQDTPVHLKPGARRNMRMPECIKSTCCCCRRCCCYHAKPLLTPSVRMDKSLQLESTLVTGSHHAPVSSRLYCCLARPPLQVPRPQWPSSSSSLPSPAHPPVFAGMPLLQISQYINRMPLLRTSQ